MRLCSFQGVDGPRPGLVVGDTVTPLAVGSALDVIRGADAVPAGDPIALSDVILEPPVTPGAALGIGLNYRAHADETGMTPPDEPLLFAKMRGSITRPSGPVLLPPWTRALDYEGELGVVIGRTARDVAVADALAAADSAPCTIAILFDLPLQELTAASVSRSPISIQFAPTKAELR